MPANVTLNPPFSDLSELPIADCDGWLYTAAWDGLPTLLIELARLGMPIVASAVGGVPELVDEATGWPVRGADDPAAYVDALQAMLSQDADRLSRATALQARYGARHLPERYAQAIAGLLAGKLP
jgi:glycosyltransferase involved in cell wall biosynthesis